MDAVMLRFLSRPRGLAVPLGLVGSLVLALAGCSKPAQPKAPPPPQVSTTLAQPGRLAPVERLPGLIAPFQNVAIQSTLTEPADSVAVAEGDRVSKGQVIARLDTADLQAQLQADLATAQSDAASATHTVYQGSLTIAQSQQSVRNAQAAVGQAQQTLAKDSLDLARYRQLQGNGYVSDQQVAQQSALVRNDAQAVNSARATLASAQEQVAANGTLGSGGLQSSSVAQARATQQVAVAQAQQVRTSIAKAAVVSPIDGVVVNRNLNIGEYPGTRQIFTLQQTDPVYAILRGSGAQIAQIQTGATAQIMASDVSSRTHFTGSVIGVLNQINPGSTDFQVKVLLRNPGGKLRPGMAIAGNVLLPIATGIKVPVTAFTDDSHDAVMVVDNGDTIRTASVVESASDDKHAIVTGLRPGQRVVSNGQTSVGDGQKVAVR